MYLLALGKLHLHPVNEMHQFRPTLTYLDILSRKNRRRGPGSDSDSDDGPPPDPDEVAPAPAPKKEKKSAGDSKEVHVSARKSEDQGGQSGLSTVRREMLQIIRNEEDEKWEDLQFCDVTVRFIVVLGLYIFLRDLCRRTSHLLHLSPFSPRMMKL